VRGKQRFFLHALSKLKRTPSPSLSPLSKGERGRKRLRSILKRGPSPSPQTWGEVR
jgi:hypothetical protein